MKHTLRYRDLGSQRARFIMLGALSRAEGPDIASGDDTAPP